MRTSLFDLFKIGIGPSSSHTMGPMRAAYRFASELAEAGELGRVARMQVDLFGSLGLTGEGHGTNYGILLGLAGERPDEVDPLGIAERVARIYEIRRLTLFRSHTIDFAPQTDFVFHRSRSLPGHPNGMRFKALDAAGGIVRSEISYSIGGGSIVGEDMRPLEPPKPPVPYPFRSGLELLSIAESRKMGIHEVALANECALRSAAEVRSGIARIWEVMQACIRRGLRAEGMLPGGLGVRRRAADLRRRLAERPADNRFSTMDWLNVWAIAVNEENAAGGQVVTAPTNGAAGIVPSVASYYVQFMDGDQDGIERYFLTATAIGALYRDNASISGAEVGCQGEVGVACSMAAAGLVSALCGTNQQIEHAAEIAMEHNLGMTCDPVGGLVQIPCIERNAFGAVKSVNAARMAMQEVGGHKVTLDQVIRTMYQTGLDMQSLYKETSLGGLAVSVVEC